jgi:uncharacterized lipoprotein YajG
MNTRRHALLALLAGTAVLTGCASPQVTDYAQERPQLELDRYNAVAPIVEEGAEPTREPDQMVAARG